MKCLRHTGDSVLCTLVLILVKRMRDRARDRETERLFARYSGVIYYYLS